MARPAETIRGKIAIVSRVHAWIFYRFSKPSSERCNYAGKACTPNTTHVNFRIKCSVSETCNFGCFANGEVWIFSASGRFFVGGNIVCMCFFFGFPLCLWISENLVKSSLFMGLLCSVCISYEFCVWIRILICSRRIIFINWNLLVN